MNAISVLAGYENDMPPWFYEGYTTPTDKTGWDALIRDFFDVNIAKQEANRQTFIDLWKQIANRYKSKAFVYFSILNEPLMGVLPASGQANDDVNIWMGQSYSTLMERVVDGIRSTGAQNKILIDRPYTFNANWDLTVQPVNRDGIIWEDHAYIGDGYGFDTWKYYIDLYYQKYVVEFGKPLLIGEYGIYSWGQIRSYYANNWRQLIAQMVSYMDSLKLFGRIYHTWGMLNGELYTHVYQPMVPYNGVIYNPGLTDEETNYLVNMVLAPPKTLSLPFTDNFANLVNWMPINGIWSAP